MTPEEIYRRLSQGGTYSLPFLVHFSSPQTGDLYLVNNPEDVEYQGTVYTASNFTYSRPKTSGGKLTGGELAISALGNPLTQFILEGDQRLQCEVTGILEDSGDVSPIACWHHRYGTASITNGMQITFTFSNDDRLDMVFPPYMFDQDNNRGNA